MVAVVEETLVALTDDITGATALAEVVKVKLDDVAVSVDELVDSAA